MTQNYYNSGDWNCLCDVCGKKLKASETLHRWDGFIVCKDDWEPRQPQDFVKARTDHISVPFSRPEATDTFVVCNAFTRQGVADSGTADCAQADQNRPFFNTIF
jgi:hypothetical protein